MFKKFSFALLDLLLKIIYWFLFLLSLLVQTCWWNLLLQLLDWFGLNICWFLKLFLIFSLFLVLCCTLTLCSLHLLLTCFLLFLQIFLLGWRFRLCSYIFTFWDVVIGNLYIEYSQTMWTLFGLNLKRSIWFWFGHLRLSSYFLICLRW